MIRFASIRISREGGNRSPVSRGRRRRGGYGLFLGAVIALSACNSEPRDILEVPDSAPAPQEPASRELIPEPDANPSLTEGVPSELSDIRKPSDIQFGEYDRDLAKFAGLEIGMQMEKAEIEVLNYMAPEKGAEGNAVFEMDKFQGYVGGQAFVATIDRMADDSVKAQQLYAIGKKGEDETYTLVDYGMRIKCWRSENPNEWRTGLCP